MSVHVDDAFMEGNQDTLEKIKENIKLNFNIQDSGKVKKFFIVYCERVQDAKCLYEQMTIEKDVRKLL